MCSLPVAFGSLVGGIPTAEVLVSIASIGPAAHILVVLEAVGGTRYLASIRIVSGGLLT